MSAARDSLQEKFAELLAWERRKRHEQTALSLAGVAVALAIVLLPLNGSFPMSWLRWVMPLLLMLAIAPWFVRRWRWRQRDRARALVKLDKTLNLAERATTAWELSARNETSAAAELVFKQAEENLRAVQARGLFPRQWGWQSYAAAPLFALWFGLLWFDADESFVNHRLPAPPTLAHKVQEFSRELQEKAKSEGLSESLKAGQELEQAARKNLDAKSTD